MPTMPRVFRPGGEKSAREVRQRHDQDRGSARERGYDSRWSKAAASDRRDNPLCAYCELEGRITAATLTDHLYPHRLFAGVFWLKHWWVSSCGPCHSGFKQALERRGKAAIDALADRLGRPRHP
ncbi:hypothetical protein [Sphingomonas montanisoli]|uniref:HNH endonuclease n=1 Tax=Sphingomonas montanisoli TaxID=2606412 RepID=A0A5D9C925_9SPHN|nr:hypothetical protein [Sphingomonas montanisoli]TZG26495.1 hypothetical protein FYJ91_16365 [Sphingomonas montanisoli]